MNLEYYAARGMRLIPLRRDSKIPCIRPGRGFAAASDDIDTLKAWAKKFPDCNWGCVLANSGLVAVDVDAKGVDVWDAITDVHGTPETLQQLSGSRIGGHYVFRENAAFRYRGKIADGIDVKHHGFIVVSPSVHKSGNTYEWVNPNDAPAEMPKWLSDLCVAGTREDKPRVAPVVDPAKYPRLAELVTRLATVEFGYDEWLKIGMALHAETGGSDDGLNLFLQVTHGVNYKEGDEDTAAYKWDTFDTAGGVGLGTLERIAGSLVAGNPTGDFKPTWQIQGQRFLASSPEEVVEIMNAEGWAWIEDVACAALVDMAASPPTVSWRKGDQFRGALAPYGHMAVDARGNTKFVCAAETWIKSSTRRVFKGIAFDPDLNGTDYVNMWTPIPCTPIPGDVSDIQKLLTYLCGKRPSAVEYIMDWCAHLVQRPHEHTSVAPVFIGEQGTGKNMYAEMIMGGILKHLFVLFGSADCILEPFNSDQGKRFLTVLDEATWSNNKKIVSKLKNLTGSTTIQINQKFAPQYTLKHFSRYIILSNNVDAVCVEPGNRRYLILESTDVLSPDFFEALGKRIESGEAIAAWYHFLLQRDISAFKPRRFPTHIDTEGNDSKVAAMGPVGQFWYEILCIEPMAIWSMLNNGTIALSRRRVADAYNEWAKSNGERPLIGNRFWLSSRPYIGHTDEVRPTDGQRYLNVTPSELRRTFVTRNRLHVLDVDFDDVEYINGFGDLLDDMGF